MTANRIAPTARTTAFALMAMATLFCALAIAVPQAWAFDDYTAATLSAQGDEEGPQTYEFENGAIKVQDVASGTLSYDADSKTLSLDNVSARGIYLDGCSELTVNLSGTYTSSSEWETTFIYDSNYYDDSKCDIAITGAGTAEGSIRCGGDLSISGVTVAGSVACKGKLTLTSGGAEGHISCYGLDMSGGSLLAEREYDYDNALSCSGPLHVSGGTFQAKGDFYCSDAATVTGGSFSVVDSLECGGELTLETGVVEGYVACNGLVLPGCSMVKQPRAYDDGNEDSYYEDDSDYSISCGSITVEHDTFAIKNDVTCNGRIVLEGGSVEGFISCNELAMSGGSLIAKDNSGNYDRVIHCYGPLNVSGGTFVVEGQAYISGKASIKAGTITDGVRCYDQLALEGGSIGGHVLCQGLTMTGGTLTAKPDDYYDNAIECNGAMSVSGGTFKADGDVNCSGSMTMKNGTVNGNVRCDDRITLSGGSIAGRISCHDLAMTGGTLTAKSGNDYDNAIYCEAAMSVSGGTLTAERDNSSGDSAVYCNGTVRMLGGTVKVNGDLRCWGAATLKTGTINGNVDCGAPLAMQGGTINGCVDCDGFNMSKGAIRKTGGDHAVSCNGNFTMSGGSITASKCDRGVYVYGPEYKTYTATISGGSINCSSPSNGCLYLQRANLNVRGGTIKVTGPYGDDITAYSETYRGKQYGGSMTVSGGTLSLEKGIYLGGAFAMSKGAITVAKASRGISANGPISIKGGTINVQNPKEYGLFADTGNISISGGNVKVQNSNYDGIRAYAGNITISGGTVKVLKSYDDGLCASSTRVRGKTRGGKVAIKGGLVSVTVRKPADYSAVSADSMTNKASCLKSVTGRLAKGATFKVGANVYKLGTKGYSGDAVLVKYGAKSKAPVFNKVKYGGVSYDVRGVGKSAFATKTGAKVTSITFKNSVDSIGANAFGGTKALASLKFSSVYYNEKYTASGKLKSVKWSSSAAVDKKAFANCGKGSGRGLTITLFTRGVFEQYAGKYKALFTSKGAPKSVKLKTYR